MASLHVVFLSAFIGGLVLAVFAMLHGVEYARANRSRAPSPFLNLPAIAAFAVAFGAVGYPLTHTMMVSWAIILVALLSGALATTGVVILLAGWALRAGTASPAETNADEIQGQFAVVSEEIAASSTGEISYEYRGRKLRARAQSVGLKSLPIGSEVVIERIQDGVALVEEWESVERRL